MRDCYWKTVITNISLHKTFTLSVASTLASHTHPRYHRDMAAIFGFMFLKAANKKPQ